jgi:hypothetical protein
MSRSITSTLIALMTACATDRLYRINLLIEGIRP